MQTKRTSKKEDPIIEVSDLTVAYNGVVAFEEVSIDIQNLGVTSFIGPSGCGKTTLLRSINRMNDLLSHSEILNGTIYLKGLDIYSNSIDVTDLRKRIGMVFQKSNPFPKTVYDNVVYGLKIQGVRSKSALDEAVQRSLESAALWDEVKDRLHVNAFTLSGGQQQRLCIARALAVQPDILLMDEPCSALDPIATAKIEELIHTLKRKYTIVIVTHNMQQAARVSDRTAFFNVGKLVEYDVSDKIFMNPRQPETEAYVSGRFG